jgi:hypothetical protein
VYDPVRESCNRGAERYAEEMGGELSGKPVDRALLRPLTELASTVEETTGPGSVADLGCGPGHIADYLAAKGVSGGEAVDLDMYFLEPAEVIADVGAAGFVVTARTDREPLAGRRVGEPALLSALPEVLSFHLCQGWGGWRSPPG